MKSFSSVVLFILLSISFPFGILGQTIAQKVKTAFQQFEQDPQLANAISSLYIIEDNTANIIFDKNSRIGLAPASTQKTITSISAYELLGKDFRYATIFGLGVDSLGQDNVLYILPSGDPSFGSSRWQNTKAGNLLQRVIKNIGDEKISTIVVDSSNWEKENLPEGWIWQDLANYYGAGSEKLTWRENQFDIILKSGSRIGDPVHIVSTNPLKVYNYKLTSYLTSAGQGSGDNAYIFFPVNSDEGFIRGTIPVNQNRFSISGSLPSGALQFVNELKDTLSALNLFTGSKETIKNISWVNNASQKITPFYTETSPPLDSIIFWFNRKSVNLFGEALIKSIAFNKAGYASTDKGLELAKNFWQTKGINTTELNMFDGSGLSPLNRVTTHAQVEILKYARKQSWFPSFYESLPLYNGMKMKSGTITNVKGFTGYHTSSSGKIYIFSFLVNNYNGSSATLVRKMYKVLDVLK